MVLGFLFSGDNNPLHNEIGGADAVTEAIVEARSDGPDSAVLGEPKLIDKGRILTDMKIEVPAYSDVPVAPLYFDVPKGEEEGDFDEFLDAVGEDISSIQDVEGTEVGVEKSFGSYRAVY